MSTIKVTAEVKQEIDYYKQFMLEHEYTIGTALGYSTYLSRYLRFSPPDTMDSLQENIAVFLKEQRENNLLGVFKECRAALYLYFKMITGVKFPKRLPENRNPENEAILNRFYDYSINIKRVQPNSVLNNVSHIRCFLECMTDDSICRLEDITANEIRDFVIEHLAHLSDSSKGSAVAAIRNFFRFQKFEGIKVHESIFLLPLSPAVWKNAAFTKTMDEEVFCGLSELPDTHTPTGKRDCCIILCFTELALRSIEVAALSVDDFNWHEGYVTIKNTKNHADRSLPISKKLCKAIIEYIQTARPKSTSRTLFVRFKHTCGEPMGCSQIRGVVRRVYAKCSTAVNSTGTHILRRTVGSRLYNSGNSLKMTADILGHESLDSTALYVKSDMVGLRQVAAPWPSATAKAGA